MGKQPELNITDWENKLPVIFWQEESKCHKVIAVALPYVKTKQNKKDNHNLWNGREVGTKLRNI